MVHEMDHVEKWHVVSRPIDLDWEGIKAEL